MKVLRLSSSPNKAEHAKMNLARLNGHQNLTEDEVFHAKIQQSEKDLVIPCFRVRSCPVPKMEKFKI